MKRLWRHVHEASAFERDLHPELLASERTRAWVMLGVFGVLGVLSASLALAHHVGLLRVPDGIAEPPSGTLALFSVAVVLYEIGLLGGLRVVERMGRIVPDPPRYANSLVEVTFVTVVLVIFARAYEPVMALDSPALLTYSILIVLSTLRLSFALSLFTGLAAGLEYLGLALYYLGEPPAKPSADWLRTFGFDVGKAIFLIISGVVAGIVARQIHKRIETTVRLHSERAHIVSTFGQYISPEVADRLIGQPGELPAELRPVTVMFLDIRGFTRFAERRSPTEVVAYLNELFGFMIDSVNRHCGIINKFLGDGFMALFGAPLSDGHDERNAVAAARSILEELAARSREPALAATRVGIGIHAGRALVGSIGSAGRKEFTVIGDVVNLASRVEQLNKQFDSSLLVTEPVYRALEEPGTAEELPPVTVRGREAPVRVYRLA